VAKKIYSFICILVVAFASFVWIGGKVESFGRLFLVKDTDASFEYGSLYALCHVTYFKQMIPRITVLEKDTIQNAKIIVAGDSFINDDFEEKDLSNDLEDTLHIPVYRVPVPVSNPLEYLATINYQKSDKKVLVVETSELLSLDRALNYTNVLPNPSASPLSAYLDKIKYKLFDNVAVEYFFKRNVFIYPFTIFFSDLNFQLFGRIDRSIGAYTLDPPLLFQSEELNFNTRPQNPVLLAQIADTIKKLADTLEQKYNLKMIYVIIPNKYTIYGGLLVNGSYNNFLPKLQTELAKRHVDFIDLYSRYITFKDKYGTKPLLYYGGDTHYTPTGKRILVDELVNKLK
jgi:hypothetical protein